MTFYNIVAWETRIIESFFSAKPKSPSNLTDRVEEMKKGTSAIHGATFFLLKGAWRRAIYFS
jgi:hypothetical protein